MSSASTAHWRIACARRSRIISGKRPRRTATGQFEAQARAVRCFGEAREIASQYAALSLLRQARRSGAIIVLASGALYIAMKGRMAWYGLMQWALSDAMQPVGKVVLAIDRTAYILAFLLGAVGWAYISSRRVSPRFHALCRAQLKRGLLLAMAAACPMVVSVIADAVVTTLRYLEERPPVSVFFIPVLSIAIEVAFAAVLVIAIGKTLRNTLRASSLLSSERALTSPCVPPTLRS